MAETFSNVLYARVFPRQRMAYNLAAVGAFAVLTALLAQMEVRLPYTPVPITGQTIAVLLSGALLGCRRGFASQALYLAAGVAGAPVFAGGATGIAYLLGPTGGYLISFPLAAALLGALVERGASRSLPLMAASLVLADLLIVVCGTFWLHQFHAVPLRRAWVLGFYPFLVSDLLKLALVAVPLPALIKRLPPAPK